MENMTPEMLAGVAGIILSLIFSYVPGLNAKFALLDGIYKRLVMLGLIFLVALGVFGLSCAGLFNYVTCDQGGAWLLLGIFIQAAIANQSAYLVSPEARTVAEIKMAQKEIEARVIQAGIDSE